MAIVETAIFGTSTRRAYAVERILGLVKPRETKALRQDSGRIAKARRGQHALSEELVGRIATLFPDIAHVMLSPLWALARTGEIPSDCGDEGYGTLDDAAYWAIHVPIPIVASYGQRGRAWLCERLTEDTLCRLAAQGSLDSVAALWMLLLEGGTSKFDPGYLLTVARYIPPAIALVSLTPAGSRIAALLFARIRQLILDGLTADGHQLSLEGYDLSRVAQSVCGWSPGCIGPANPYAKTVTRSEIAPAPPEIHDWITRGLAPLRLVRRGQARPPWRAELAPSGNHTEVKWDCSVTLHPKAITLFRKELGAYF